VTDTGEFQVKLKARHASVRSAKLKIHITIMIFGPNDVGEQFVALQLPVITGLARGR
jgi:hypothetical protein